MKYKTITNSDDEGLDTAVNERLNDGWMLYGDPYLFGANLCAQAMTFDTTELDTLSLWLDTAKEGLKNSKDKQDVTNYRIAVKSHAEQIEAINEKLR